MRSVCTACLVIVQALSSAAFSSEEPPPGIAYVHTVAGGGKPHQGDNNDCEDEDRSRDGVGLDARFNYPWGIAYDGVSNSLFVGDCGCGDHTPYRNEKIRAINLETREVTSLAGGRKGYGDGMKDKARFSNTAGLAVHHKSRTIYLTDTGNHCIRTVEIETGGVLTLAGGPREPGFVDGIGSEARFNTPQGICIDEERNLLYISDTDNHVIRRVHIATKKVVTICGTFRKSGKEDGSGAEARFYHPTALTYDRQDDVLYVSDHYNHLIRKISSPDRLPVVTTLAGSVQGHKDGYKNEAKFDYPEGITYDPVHKVLYVTEFENDGIRVVTKDGHVGTLVGGRRGSSDGMGAVASFFHPTGMAYDPTRNVIFVTDQYNHKVRSITVIQMTTQSNFSSLVIVGLACACIFIALWQFVWKGRKKSRKLV